MVFVYGFFSHYNCHKSSLYCFHLTIDSKYLTEFFFGEPKKNENFPIVVVDDGDDDDNEGLKIQDFLSLWL